MAKKKASKPLGKKSMKTTKGGILIGLRSPALSLSPKVLPKGGLFPPVPCNYPPICN